MQNTTTMNDVCCVVCGEDFGRHHHYGYIQWKKQYRILFSEANDVGVSISGIGFNSPQTPLCLVPNEFRLSSNDVQATLLQCAIGTQCILDFDRYGFPIHSACWSLIEKKYSFGQPDGSHVRRRGHFLLNRLYLLFKSLPSQYPHELSLKTFLGLKSCQIQNYRPIYNLAGSLIALQGQDRAPPPPLSEWNLSKDEDCFAILPEELRVKVASYLSSNEFYNARLASKGFWGAFHCQEFWLSRFAPGGERFWVAQALDVFHETVSDAKLLYHQTSSGFSCTELRNGTRIGRMIEAMASVLDLTIVPVRAPANQVHPSQLPTDVSLDVRPDNSADPFENFESGCRNFWVQEFEDLSTIVYARVSFVMIKGEAYVCGLGLRGDNGTYYDIGYRSSKQVRARMTSLAGIVVANTATSIRAMRFVNEQGQATPWLGNPTGVPQTMRAVKGRQLRSIKVGMDGFRLVNLTVEAALDEDNQGLAVWFRSLRFKEHWLPSCPPANLSLNEGVFRSVRRRVRSDESDWYKRRPPLRYVSFGGKEGELLSKVTGFQYETRAQSIVRFNFTYADDQEPAEIDSELVGLESHHLPIDGPGGERIVHVQVQYCPSEGARPAPRERRMTQTLSHIRFHTNRKRIVMAPVGYPSHDWVWEWEFVDRCDSPKIITGLYAHVGTSGIRAIGAVSQTSEVNDAVHE